MKDKIALLRKVIPFKWRVQSTVKTGKAPFCQMIAYVDARDVAEHLDDILGPENWCDRYYEVKGNLFCSIGIKIDDEWIHKSDVGKESAMDKEKGESSDAFKRAAVKWGVNRDAYRVGVVKLDAKEYNNKWYPCDKDGKFFKGKALHDHCNSIAQIQNLENYDLDIKTGSDDWDDLIALFELKKEFMKPESIIATQSIIDDLDKANFKKTYDNLNAL